MPLYFFHLRDGSDIALDPEGREFSGLEEATKAAVADARSMISSDALAGQIVLNQRIDIEDPSGEVLRRVNFSDAVEILGAGA